MERGTPLATRDAVRHGRRFGISLLPAEGQKASERQHAVVRPSTSCSAQSWCCGPAPCIRVPHISANAGVGAGRKQLRPKTGAGATPALQHQNHSGRLCAGHYTGQAGGSGDVLGPIVKGLMDREKPGNEPHCLADAFVLWAYCGLGQIECFEVSALKRWWPGTESNRRRQPFQGCALPAELPGHKFPCGYIDCSVLIITILSRSRQTARSVAIRKGRPNRPGCLSAIPQQRTVYCAKWNIIVDGSTRSARRLTCQHFSSAFSQV